MHVQGPVMYVSMCLFQGKMTAQGKLLLQGSLQVMEQSKKAEQDKARGRGDPRKDSRGDPKFKERRVFLFEQIIIFSEEIEKKKNNLSNPGYIFKHCLQVSVTTAARGNI